MSDCLPDRNENPCDSNFLTILLQELKKLISKPTVKKEPITPDILRSIMSIHGSSDNLLDVKLCAILVSFAGFLRHNELVYLHRSNFMILVN